MQPLPVDGRFLARPDPLSLQINKPVPVCNKISTVTDRHMAGRARDGSVRSPTQAQACTSLVWTLVRPTDGPHHCSHSALTLSRAASAMEYYLNRRNHIISQRASPWIPTDTLKGNIILTFHLFRLGQIDTRLDVSWEHDYQAKLIISYWCTSRTIVASV